jgi:NAD-dependent SIR2 family protein deacetylase
MQFDLFGMPDNDYQAGTMTAPDPQEDQASHEIKKQVISFMGKDFVVSRCARCSQMILIDPVYEDQDKGKTCEACNPNNR